MWNSDDDLGSIGPSPNLVPFFRSRPSWTSASVTVPAVSNEIERERESNGVVEWLAFVLPIWEAPGSDTGTETVYADAKLCVFLQSFHSHSKMDGFFFSRPFQEITVIHAFRFP